MEEMIFGRCGQTSDIPGGNRSRGFELDWIDAALKYAYHELQIARQDLMKQHQRHLDFARRNANATGLSNALMGSVVHSTRERVTCICEMARLFVTL